MSATPGFAVVHLNTDEVAALVALYYTLVTLRRNWSPHDARIRPIRKVLDAFLGDGWENA